jgi:hypothetical protein
VHHLPQLGVHVIAAGALVFLLLLGCTNTDRRMWEPTKAYVATRTFGYSSLQLYDILEHGGLRSMDKIVTTCHLPLQPWSTQQTKMTSRLDIVSMLLITTLIVTSHKRKVLYLSSTMNPQR